MARIDRLAAAVSLAAALSLAASPAAAAELPAHFSLHPAVATPGLFDADADNAASYRRYRYRHHNRIDGGDVLAGVLIIGGIAAIASAASRRDAERRESYPQRYPERDRDYDYRDRRGDSRYDGGRGLDRAVDMCVREIERDVRVDGIDAVERSGAGWRVTGALYNGERFTCRIGASGRIEGVDYGASAASGTEDRQWSDDRYEAAWSKVSRDENGRIASAPAGGAVPPYPGGPIDGDPAGDDRYDMADPPDPGG